MCHFLSIQAVCQACHCLVMITCGIVWYRLCTVRWVILELFILVSNSI